jgi:hypothetical protein
MSKHVNILITESQMAEKWDRGLAEFGKNFLICGVKIIKRET